MKQELEYLLETTYPFMARNEDMAKQFNNMYQQFGCEIDDGWFSLLNSLCEEIMQVYHNHACQPNIVVDQVKEKYGTLRFYYHFRSRQDNAHTPHTLADLNFKLSTNNISMHKEIANIIRKRENESLTVCEKCGARGVLRTEQLWIYVLCDDCLNKKT